MFVKTKSIFYFSAKGKFWRRSAHVLQEKIQGPLEELAKNRMKDQFNVKIKKKKIFGCFRVKPVILQNNCTSWLTEVVPALCSFAKFPIKSENNQHTCFLNSLIFSFRSLPRRRLGNCDPAYNPFPLGFPSRKASAFAKKK